MKKVLLFVSTVFLSFLFLSGFTTLAESENKVYAQEDEEPPIYLSVVNYRNYEFLQENAYTYEYLVTYYTAFTVPETIGHNDYFLINNINVNFRKGINRNTNSYEFERKTFQNNMTNIVFRITVLKNLVDSDYPTNIAPLFYRDTIMYVNATLYVYDDFYNDAYNRGYNAGYEDGYNDFNVVDYLGDRNIARAPDIDYGTASPAFEPTTTVVLINKGVGAPNIVLDKPYLIVMIKKNIYDDVVVFFNDDSSIDHRNATYHNIEDFDIYVFNLSNRINSKYRLEISKKNVTTSEQANQFLKDVKDNLYFSHASRLLDSEMVLSFYEVGYITGLEKSLSNHEAYEAGYENGYNNGYIDGKEDGYELGYEDGFDYGKTAEYEHGYQDGYNDGYSDGISKPFFSNFHVWIVPAIIIVVIAGIFVGYRRERYGGD